MVIIKELAPWDMNFCNNTIHLKFRFGDAHWL
jgi:hypothetical protein